MNAREQAREEAEIVDREINYHTAHAIADAASDVWEKIVREIWQWSNVPVDDAEAMFSAITQIESLCAEALNERA